MFQHEGVEKFWIQYPVVVERGSDAEGGDNPWGGWCGRRHDSGEIFEDKINIRSFE